MPTKTLTASYILDSTGVKAGVDESVGQFDRLAGESDALGSKVDESTSRLGNGFKSLGNQLGNFGIPFSSALTNMGEKLDETKSKGSSFGSVMSTVGGATLGIAAVGFAAVAAESVHLATEFQSTVTSIAANANIPVSAAQKIGSAFLSTAGTTIFSGQQIGQAYAGVAGQLGTLEGKALNSTQALDIMKVAMDLAEGSGTSLNSATTGLVQTLQAFQLPISQATTASDVLFSTARALSTNVDTVSSSFTRLRGQLGAASPTLSQMGGLMIDLAQHGEANSRAMRSVTTSLAGLLTPTTAVTKAQEFFGVSFKNSSGNLDTLDQIISQVQPKIAGMGDVQATAMLKALGFGSASGKLVQTIQAGVPALDTATSAASRMGSAHEAAQKQSQTLSHQVELLKATAMDYGTSLGEALIPKLEDVAHDTASVVEWFTRHKAVAEALAVAVGTVLAGAVAVFTVNMVSGMIASTRSALTSLGILKGATDTESESTTKLTEAMTSLETQLAALTTPTQSVVTAQDAVNTAWQAADELATTLDAGLTTLAEAYAGVGTSAESAAGELSTFDAAATASAGELERLGASATTAAGEIGGVGGAAELAGGKMAAAGGAEGAAGLEAGLGDAAGAGEGLGASLGGPVIIGVAAAAFAIVGLTKLLGNDQTAWENTANSALSMANVTIPQAIQKHAALQKALDQTKAAQDKLTTSTDQVGGSMGRAGGTANILAANELAAKNVHDQLRTSLDQVNAAMNLQTSNLTILSSNFGISKAQAQGLSQQLGINLKAALSPSDVQAFATQLSQTGQTMDTTGQKAQNMGATTVSAVSRMAAQMQTTLSSADWVQLGADVDGGVASGITEANGVVINSVNGMVASVISSARTGLKAASPSRVAADLIGATIPQGVAVGIDENASTAQSAVSRMVGGIVSGFGSGSFALPRIGAEIPALSGGFGAGPGAGVVGGASSTNVYVNVQGNVLSERNLTDAVWQGLLEKGVVNGTSGQLTQTGG